MTKSHNHFPTEDHAEANNFAPLLNVAKDLLQTFADHLAQAY
ncbi:MAG: hypothetical protein WCJ39_00875 [bacterium]